MERIDHSTNPIDFETFTATLHASDTYTQGVPGRQQYIDISLQRLYRVFSNLMACGVAFQGPTLDVASGWGILYPVLRQHLPNMLPYHIAEMAGWTTVIDGDVINGCKFECEKDTLAYPDQTFGSIMFIDTLEHLIVDPFWTLLEFNRVLKTGGHLVISTPNAISAHKIVNILNGINPATEAFYKPTAIYQRHNREWSPTEVGNALSCLGFDDIRYTTNHQMLEMQRALKTRATVLLRIPMEDRIMDLGPELFVVGQKSEHLTLDSDMPKSQRWPEWLYTAYDAYRRRPSKFPINITEDYA